MDIEKIAIRNVLIDEDFDYRTLFSDSRGAILKEEMKFLISESISQKEITIEKFVIAENVEDELFDIIETKGLQRLFLRRLKNNYRESDYHFAPMIYLLKKFDPDFKLSTENEKLEIVSDLFEVEIRPRIDGKNAEPRLFFQNEKIAFTSTNDDVRNLAAVLSVKDVTVYAIDTDTYYNDIYAYKINRTERYFEVAEGFKDDAIARAGERISMYSR